MPRRIIEDHQEDFFSGLENARKYAEEAEKSSKMRFRGFLKRLLESNVKGRYLEVGAGSGILATMIAENDRDLSITALDISSDMVSVAGEYIEKKGLQSQILPITGNIEDDEFIQFQDKFDFIYSTFSLHHWKNPKTVIRNLMHLLNDGGKVMIYDLKRVWWLYWIPIENGFFKSIRAAYQPDEIESILRETNVTQYKIETISPFFLQNITLWK
ncbi:MAG: class I SAM-dependent methyltransferase [Deltaproteobacteria bacterium]|nr:class I SAM-dependent methyltransferase [Deltaproteobacteria bacterium]MBN2846245.1 class I SAM-dependent methyltransferase [Deltaproteobacteria bacterium]